MCFAIAATLLAAASATHAQSLIVTPKVVRLEEGTSGKITVKLTHEPTAQTVTVSVAKRSGGDGSISSNKSSLEFSKSNWRLVHEVTLSAAQDADAESGYAVFDVSGSGELSNVYVPPIVVRAADDECGPPLAATLTATALGPSVLLSWVPGSDGGLAVSAWEYRVDGGAWTIVVGGGAVRSHILYAMDRGTHSFEVRAVNSAGPGAASAVASATLDKDLSASDITDNSATLTVSGHAGAWWRKGDQAGAVCARVSGTSDDVDDLTPGTEYTYRAYSAAGCLTDLALLGVAKFTTVKLAAEGVTRERATLRLSGGPPQWWHKADRAPYAACSSAVLATTVALTGLTGGATYAFKAYKAAGCASVDEFASVSFAALTDYDADGDGLVEIATLEQLNAVRWDPDGDGSPTNDLKYAAAFPDAASSPGNMGCPTTGCEGYELAASLDFDDSNSYASPGTGATGNKNVWTSSPGWTPIGTSSLGKFTARFDGNGLAVSGLYINRPAADDLGLFGIVGAEGVVRRLGVLGANVRGAENVGALAGSNEGTILHAWSTSAPNGKIEASRANVGGLVGLNSGTVSASLSMAAVELKSSDRSAHAGNAGGLAGATSGASSTIVASWAGGAVANDDDVSGGLVGLHGGGSIKASYASGAVSLSNGVAKGGLVGKVSVGATVSASYWDTGGTGVADDGDTLAPEGRTAAQLAAPTGYAGLYADWNLDLDNADGDGSDATGGDDPWHFGGSGELPRPEVPPRLGTTNPMWVGDSRLSVDIALSNWGGDWWYRSGSACVTATTEVGQPVVTLGGLVPLRFHTFVAYADAGCRVELAEVRFVVDASALALPAVPGKPTAAAGNVSVALTWTSNGDGGSAITGWDYAAAAGAAAFGRWTPIAGSGAATRSHTVAGLVAGTAYKFKVRAANANGNGGASPESAAVTPYAVAPPAPGKPAAAAGNRSVALTWSSGGDGGSAIVRWEYVKKTGANAWETTWRTIPGGGSARSGAVSGLVNGTAYRFKVRAVNAVGDGTSSPASDAATPAVPASLSAAATSATAATLTLANHAGDWWYRADKGPHASCSASKVPQGTSTKALTGLTAGATYAYAAYSDSGCATALASAAAFTTPALIASGVTANAATLTLSDWSAAWWHKGNETNASCSAKIAAGTKTASLSNLARGTSHTYTAYDAAGCASGDELDSVAFDTLAPGLAAERTGATGARLRLSNWTALWHYKATSGGGPHASCSTTAVPAGTPTKALSGLTTGTDYTYKAYSDGACSDALASVSLTAGRIDYDADGDGLIEISTLEQLNAVRWDTDGDGASTDAGYASAFPDAASWPGNMGCPSTHCTGYELAASLDFDDNASYADTNNKSGWTTGEGWSPINGFSATFQGNGRVVANLYINRSFDKQGLFGSVPAAGKVLGLGLPGARVKGGDWDVGALAGELYGTVRHSWSGTGPGEKIEAGRSRLGGLVGNIRTSGTVAGSASSAAVRLKTSDEFESNLDGGAGGLVGLNNGAVVAAAATGTVTANDDFPGGLIGQNGGSITASYARGRVTSTAVGSSVKARKCGLYAQSLSSGRDSHSYYLHSSQWYPDTLRYSFYCPDFGLGKSPDDLKLPTGYAGLYATWNLDLDNADGDNNTATGGDDPWHFGGTWDYPRVKPLPRLDGDAVSSTGTSTLALSSWSGAWWYKANTGPDAASCSSKVAAGTPTAALTGLTSGVDYTYAAYMDSGCAVELASNALPRPKITMGAVRSSRATLWLREWNKAWWHKKTSPAAPAGTCSSKIAAGTSTAALTGLVAGTTYTYDVYFDSACSKTLARVTFVAAELRFTEYRRSLTSVSGRLTLGGDWNGAWWYRADTGPDASSCARASGDHAWLGGLTRLATYRYTAYGAAECAAGDEIASVAFAPGTPSLRFSGADADLLMIAGWTYRTGTHQGQLRWWYKSDRDGASCNSSHQHSVVLAGLSRSTKYTFSAYRAAGCAHDDRMAIIVFTTNDADYDEDDNRLIEVATLEQLNAVRWDLDGNGSASTGKETAYALAFPGAGSGMGCPTAGCAGYELAEDLDFDDDASYASPGDSTSGNKKDWTTGSGWTPLGDSSTKFTATFDGNGRVVANLHINRNANLQGLFGELGGAAEVLDLGVAGASVSGGSVVGALAGQNQGTIRRSWSSTGSGEKIQGSWSNVGGLAGVNYGNIAASRSAADVSITRSAADVNIGGLVGQNFGRIVAGDAFGAVAGGTAGNYGGLAGYNNGGSIAASYAAGAVTGTGDKGGLVGDSAGTATVAASYWDTATTGIADDIDTAAPEGRTTAELKSPTGYAGLYADWNADLGEGDDDFADSDEDDPWHFGGADDYPRLNGLPRLDAAVGVGNTNATLTLSGWGGAWWYGADSGPDADACVDVLAGTSARVRGLELATGDHVYAAYLDAACSLRLASLTRRTGAWRWRGVRTATAARRSRSGSTRTGRRPATARGRRYRGAGRRRRATR